MSPQSIGKMPMNKEGAQLMSPRAEHVVLIDIDALSPGYLELADTPNLDDQIRRGAFGIARGVFKSFSNPARSSIVTGAWPKIHQNQAYYYDRDRDLVVGQERPYEDLAATPLRAETIAQSLAAERRTVIGIDYRNLERHGLDAGDPRRLYATPGGDCTNRIDAAIDILRGRPVESYGTAVAVTRMPDLLAIYLNDVDDLGHVEGPKGPGMPRLIAKIDYEIGRLVRGVADAGIADRTVFVVVSDHGMVGFAKPLLPHLLSELTRTSLRWEVVPVDGRPSPDTEVVIVATSRNADLTLRGAAARPEGRRRIHDALLSLGDRVLLHNADAWQEMGAPDRMGDLIAEAVPPYHLGANTDRPPGGGHGGSLEMNVPLIISGAAIQPGTTPLEPRLIDIAPTISELLGVRPPAQSQGRALTELFL